MHCILCKCAQNDHCCRRAANLHSFIDSFAKLPWKLDCPELPTIKDIVRRGTEDNIRKLSHEPEIFSNYRQIIAEQESKEFIEKVSKHENTQQRHHTTQRLYTPSSGVKGFIFNS